jgi:hypothetical protein
MSYKTAYRIRNVHDIKKSCISTEFDEIFFLCCIFDVINLKSTGLFCASFRKKKKKRRETYSSYSDAKVKIWYEHHASGGHYHLHVCFRTCY